MNIAIAGIHTGIGKTICSAILCEMLDSDYFKPVQAGELDNTDSMLVRQLVSNTACTVHPESYKLKLAASPHFAAEQEGIEIRKEGIVLPASDNDIVIETAGGLMSPLGKDLLNIDLIEHFHLPVILVSNNYLGSVNHTLLSYSLLKSRGVIILGIIFNQGENKASEDYIIKYTKLPKLFSVPAFETLNAETIQAFAKTVTLNF